MKQRMKDNEVAWKPVPPEPRPEGDSEWVAYRGGDDLRPRPSLTEPRPSNWSVVSLLRFSFKLSLLPLLFFGLLGTYYFRCTTWNIREDPHYDLLVVDRNEPAELAFFRKRTVADHMEPAMMQLEALVKLRKSSKKCTVIPVNYQAQCEEIADALREIMNSAKLRQIPRSYLREYKGTLLGISQSYRSLRSFEDAMSSRTSADRERALKESIEFSTKAKNNLQKSRRFLADGRREGGHP